mgnify:CR=1 FL=1
MTFNAMTEHYEEITVCGKPALFTTIRIKDWETDELTTTLVVAYHQDGVQAAIGPCVKL